MHRTIGLGYLLIISANLYQPISFGSKKSSDPLSEAKAAADRGESYKAVKLATAVLAVSPDLPHAYYLRGRENFRRGRISESVSDFDQFVHLRPDLESQQWERGLSYYYAGDFEKGAKQFELYQSYHDNDVENSVWRYLCIARAEGLKRARETLLPIQHDPRVPMMEIYDMFRGKATPEDILKVAHTGQPTKEQLNVRLFYAELYIGLFYVSENNYLLSKKHLLAATKHRLNHYMWNVARYHASILSKPK